MKSLEKGKLILSLACLAFCYPTLATSNLKFYDILQRISMRQVSQSEIYPGKSESFVMLDNFQQMVSLLHKNLSEFGPGVTFVANDQVSLGFNAITYVGYDSVLCSDLIYLTKIQIYPAQSQENPDLVNSEFSFSGEPSALILRNEEDWYFIQNTSPMFIGENFDIHNLQTTLIKFNPTSQTYKSVLVFSYPKRTCSLYISSSIENYAFNYRSIQTSDTLSLRGIISNFSENDCSVFVDSLVAVEVKYDFFGTRSYFSNFKN